MGTPTDLAAGPTATGRWRDTRVCRYGRTDAVQIAEIICLWYGSFRSRTVRVILVRDNKPIFTGKIASLRRFKDDVREVQSGFECGIGLENYQDLKSGDVIETYDLKEIARG